jgi:hypothetical protein
MEQPLGEALEMAVEVANNSEMSLEVTGKLHSHPERSEGSAFRF